MSGTPSLMLPLKGHPIELYRSRCVGMHLDEKTSKVTITAYNGDDVDAGCAITGIMTSTEALLAKGRPYSVVWDLRNSPVPSIGETMRLAAWGMSKKKDLEHLTKRMGIVVPNGPVASVAGGLLASFSAVPTVVSTSADEVHRFV